jgi:SAM-dependent methyltransferase
MKMKNNFSSGSEAYARFRPGYPPELADYLTGLAAVRDNAWDCGTGSGQMAALLAPHFGQVFATDISRSQLAEAPEMPNVFYSVQAAEATGFADRFFNLIVVAQAIHWFDFERFYAEVRRTAAPEAILAAVGYGRFHINERLDAVVKDFYENTIGNYWDKERRYIDDAYKTISFPFAELTPPALENTFEWTFEHLIGYLNTWSAVKHYIKAHHQNPVQLLEKELRTAWGGEEKKTVNFPLLLRMGQV